MRSVEERRACFRSTTILVLAVTTTALAADFTIDWHTIDGGGYSVGGDFELSGGFWAVTHVCTCLGDMNGNGVKDRLDIQQFADCVIDGGSCSCADVDAMHIRDSGAVEEPTLNRNQAARRSMRDRFLGV